MAKQVWARVRVVGLIWITTEAPDMDGRGNNVSGDYASDRINSPEALFKRITRTNSAKVMRPGDKLERSSEYTIRKAQNDYKRLTEPKKRK